jgi:site-specific recombinase XerD
MLVERLVAAAGIDAKRLSPHALRHTYAMRYLRPGSGASPSTRRGGDVVALSKLLGHASIATTQRYVDHLAIAELRAGLPTLPGLVARVPIDVSISP